MIVVRFRMKCKTERTEQVRAALAAVVGPSRRLEGVIHFDIGRDLTDPDSFIATEVFVDRAALDRQESLPEVASVLKLLPDSLAAQPEAILFNVSSSEPWGG
ncbi:MAG: putative quinol monooxygenase [Burkholderiaceae bacterium]